MCTLHVQLCVCVCTWLSGRAQGKPRAVHRSRRKMKSYWNQLDKAFWRAQGKTGVTPAQARPNTEGGMRV